ncbi:hypothetical protein AG1IA_00977 [Rhizoctonia solani AG-1 IA]|uniref:Uncharacterized protein n=1 Tax=Thanatephorus cucumeris (strain AG1-IA) TaxID=983506 RepID=L8X7B8_THACA|nr:hypothetical protein AG1IA_00977 [Rhizoctonia solani AG-1 IA]
MYVGLEQSIDNHEQESSKRYDYLSVRVIGAKRSDFEVMAGEVNLKNHGDLSMVGVGLTCIREAILRMDDYIAIDMLDRGRFDPRVHAPNLSDKNSAPIDEKGAVSMREAIETKYHCWEIHNSCPTDTGPMHSRLRVKKEL